MQGTGASIHGRAAKYWWKYTDATAISTTIPWGATVPQFFSLPCLEDVSRSRRSFLKTATPGATILRPRLGDRMGEVPSPPLECKEEEEEPWEVREDEWSSFVRWLLPLQGGSRQHARSHHALSLASHFLTLMCMCYPTVSTYHCLIVLT